MGIAVQLGGAVLILAAFVAAQLGRLTQTSMAYLVANVVGSALLGVDAVIEEQWGFVLLEVVWFAVSAWSLVRLVTGRPVEPSH